MGFKVKGNYFVIVIVIVTSRHNPQLPGGHARPLSWQAALPQGF
jgi:hypothetical protein